MIVDLTYSTHSGMFKYPSDPPVEVEVIKAKLEDGRYKSGFSTLNMRNHHGTHVDAPSHKIPGARTIDSYPISKFIGKLAGIFDLTEILGDRREIQLSDVKKAIETSGILDYYLSAIIFYTGFSDRISSKQGVSEADFPYFSLDAAGFIVEKFRRLDIIGIDSFSVDKQGSNSEVHTAFFRRDILPLETLVNLGELKKYVGNTMFKLFCVPLNIRKADASPVRAYAVLE